MSALARQLARLADDAPREVDIDGADTFDDGTRAHKSKRGANGASSAAVEDADLVLGAPQFRGDIDMGDDERYQGVPTSRKALRRRQRKGVAAADDSDSDSAGSSDDDSDADVAMGVQDSDSEESDGEEDDEVQLGGLSSVLANRVPTDDIEAELDALEAGDEQMLMRQRADEDKDKAQHTRHQIELWERTLELRIRAQKAMTMAHRLPKAASHALFATAKPELGTALKEASGSVMTLLDTLGELHDELVDQSGCLQAPEGGFGSDIDSDDAGAGGGTDPIDAQWRKMQRRWAAVEPQVVDVVTEWQRKLLFSSGFSAKKQLKVVNQDIRKQTDAVLSNRDVLVERCRLKRTEATREFGNALTYDFGSAGTGDPDTYDDPDFYQQMLREFIKTSSSASLAPEARRQTRKRTKKNVDRKASKGRRLRYHAHPKLVNFMAPIPAPEPPLDLDSLHASLFKSRS